MENGTKHRVMRFVSACLSILLLFSVAFPVVTVYATEGTFEKVTLALNSNVVDDDTIDLYLLDSVYYISLDDLCRLVRCTKSVDGDVISVTQGFWRAEFDVENSTFYDGYQLVDTTIVEISKGNYAVSALMFLSYYKAMAFIRNGTLYCKMNKFTAWEALDVDYANSLIDIYELYGGEGNVTLSLTLDIIMDFIMGDMSTSDDYISDAFLETLKVELPKQPAVQEYTEKSAEEIHEYIHSDKGEEYIKGLESFVSISSEPLEDSVKYLIESYYYTKEKSFVEAVYNAKLAGKPVDTASYGEKFYDAFQKKNQAVNSAEKYFENADYLMMFISAAIETAQQMKYTEATNNLIYNVMGQENLNYLKISADGNEWFVVANRYQNVLGVAATQLEAETMQLFTDKLYWETLIGTGVSSAAGISEGAWTVSLEFARWFTERFPLTASSIEAFKADRRALYLSELQQNVYWVAQSTLKAMRNQWNNPEIYTKYIQVSQMYCRTSIAMYANLIKMVNEFGQDRDYWTNLFQSRIDMLAVSLYQLTTIQDDGTADCLPLELSTFNDSSAGSDISSVVNNGGLAVGCKGVTLYWNISKYEGKVFYILVSESENGEIKEIYESEQRSNIYVVGDSIFLNHEGESYRDSRAVSIDFEGDVKSVYNYAKVVGVDKISGCLLMDYPLGPNGCSTKEASYFIYSIVDDNLTKIEGLSDDSYFLKMDNGSAYFGQSCEDGRGVRLLSYDIKHGELKELSKSIATYPMSMGPGYGYTPCEIIATQITDNAIYYSFGYYGGSSMALQESGGAIIRVSKSDCSSSVVFPMAKYYFYAFRRNQKEYVVANGQLIDVATGACEETDMVAQRPNRPFETYDDGVVRCWMYLSDDGEAKEVLPGITLESVGAREHVGLGHVECVGTMVFYDVLYRKSVPNPYSLNDLWIDSKLELFVYDSTTGVTRLLSSATYD